MEYRSIEIPECRFPLAFCQGHFLKDICDMILSTEKREEGTIPYVKNERRDNTMCEERKKRKENIHQRERIMYMSQEKLKFRRI